MTIIESLILGIVQGLTEFLPISSSGHLNVFPWLFNWPLLSDGMDVALHIGTLLALAIVFLKDWIKLITAGYRQVVKRKNSKEGRMFWYLVAATIPAGILSLVLDKLSKATFGHSINLHMLIIAGSLIIMGIILYVVDKKSKSKIDFEHISLKQTVLIGMSQAIAAAFPGVSRAGITVTTARMLKIDRESAARLSFLLAMPITLAAVIFECSHFAFNLNLLIGVLASFIVGMFVIRFLLNYLRKGSYKVFAIYRILFGAVIIIFYCIR